MEDEISVYSSFIECDMVRWFYIGGSTSVCKYGEQKPKMFRELRYFIL